jgi:hypothetical protein
MLQDISRGEKFIFLTKFSLGVHVVVYHSQPKQFMYHQGQGKQTPARRRNHMKLGRENLDWSPETWAHIDKAVHDEAQRVRIAMKYIPINMATTDTLSVPAESIETVDLPPTPLFIDEGKTISIFEILTSFSMTKQQAGKEVDVTTAITLATRATNILIQGEDILMFQGDSALETGANPNPLFATGRIRHRNNSFGTGLLGAVAAIPDPPGPASQTIEVEPTSVSSPPSQNTYGENTFGAVSAAYSRLQSKGHYGPYALALHSDVYADTFAPLEKTLIMPADRIKPLVTAGFHGTGTLPPFTGVLVSLGGNTMDLVVGMDAITAFLQEDTDGLYQFRVFERFTLRLKDVTAVIKLDFEQS